MLEVWEARRLDRVLTSGRTKPVVLECVLADKHQSALRLMVVKAMGPSEVTETGLMCELFGNLLARELGVQSPECALVNISLQMANALRPRLHPPGFTGGFGVGSGRGQRRGAPGDAHPHDGGGRRRRAVLGDAPAAGAFLSVLKSVVYVP